MEDPRIASLLCLSARLGGNPLLVQAGTGNTSIKIGGVLWIKASGKWLAHAGQNDNILVPVDLAETRGRVQQDADPAGQCCQFSGKSLRTSVETAMHAVLPQRVVLHVHSVNTIAWAVQRDAASLLAQRLEGLQWKWIPYVASGLPLAREVERAIASAPDTNVLVLANHGLVVCGDTCEAAEELLRQVEARVAITPRHAPEPDLGALTQFAAASHWRLPPDPSVHSLGTDAWCRTAFSTGVLYPCQAIFLSPRINVMPRSALSGSHLGHDPFLIVEGAGVLVSDEVTAPACATLTGLAQVLLRIDPGAPLRYLNELEIDSVMSVDTYRYRELVETNGPGGGEAFVS
jgi:rhamnose utilization protein RhaD (predicted bifunctional aldolase and dehydrogenase)